MLDNTARFTVLVFTCLMAMWEIFTIYIVNHEKDPDLSQAWIVFKLLIITGMWEIPVCFMTNPSIIFSAKFWILVPGSVLLILTASFDGHPDSLHTIFKNHNHFTFGE